MHVNRSVGQGGSPGQRFGSYGTQAVRCNAHAAISRQLAQRFRRAVPEPGEPVMIVSKSDLAGTQRPAVATAELIVHRQQRQADPGPCGGGGDPLRHLREIVVRLPPRLMMKVVEFDIGGVTGLQHLHLHEGGDRFDMLRRQFVEEAEHQLPPSPEGVAGVRAAPLRQARHRPLERMAVGVGRSGQEDVHQAVTGARCVALHRADRAVRTDGNADGIGPSRFGQRVFGPDRDHPAHPLTLIYVWTYYI